MAFSLDFQKFSQKLGHFFLTVGLNNFDNKIIINQLFRILQNDFPVDKTNFLTLFPAATPVFPGVLFKQIDADDKDLNTVYSDPIHNEASIILIYHNLLCNRLLDFQLTWKY